MTTRKRSLPQRFPGKNVLRCKVWATNGDSLEVDGPMSPVAYRLLVALLVRLHPDDAQGDAMWALVRKLEGVDD